jgi:stage V sporulation protein AD
MWHEERFVVTKLGRQSWSFERPIALRAVGTVAGQLESEGPLQSFFDVKHTNDRLNGETWEKSEQLFFQQATEVALQKADLRPEQVGMVVGGDLSAQLTSFYMGLKEMPIPMLGVYSACATICEALIVAGMLVEQGYADYAVAGTSSHTSAAERQFRYPTEYGVQKPPTAQRTVSGSGVAVLGGSPQDIVMTHATIGRIVDFGVTSPWEMGAAMAPAALDTLVRHFADTGRSPADYDCIATGDLGHIGHQILREMLEERGFSHLTQLTDCGMLIYSPHQSEVFSGGSGGACCSLVTFGYLLHELKQGKYRRILVSATGALLSSVSAQQGQSIPGISHAIVLERKEAGS